MTQTTLLLIVLAVVIVVGFIVISRKPNARHPSDEVTPPVVEPGSRSRQRQPERQDQRFVIQRLT